MSPTQSRSSIPLLILVALVCGLVAAFLYWQRDPELQDPPPLSLESLNQENPDRDQLINVQTHPFRSEWVGGTLRVCYRGGPKTLNNLLRTRSSEANYHWFFLTPPLLIEGPDRDGDRSLFPHLARDYPNSEDGGRSWIWELKEGLTWEDGTAVTARTCLDSLALLRDEIVKCNIARDALRMVESIEVLDPLRFRVTFDQPVDARTHEFGLEFRIFPVHQIQGNANRVNTMDRHFSCGPYRVVSFEKELLVLQLRDEYRGAPHPIGPRYAETVEFHYIANEDARWAKMRHGELDVMAVSAERIGSAARDIAMSERAWRATYLLPACHFICWNQRDPDDPSKPHPSLSDPRVRQGMKHLIPRKRIIDELYSGLGMVHDAPWDFRDSGVDQEIPLADFDPQKASRLFQDAGFALNEDGVLEREGALLEFQLLHLANPPASAEAALVLQTEAKKVGVIIHLRALNRSLMGQVNRRNFDAYWLIWRWRPMLDGNIWANFHSSLATGETPNAGAHADAETDEILDALESERDPAERTALRWRFHRRFAELEPFSYLFYQPSCVLISRRWANVKIHDMGLWYRDFILRSLWERSPPDGF